MLIKLLRVDKLNQKDLRHRFVVPWEAVMNPTFPYLMRDMVLATSFGHLNTVELQRVIQYVTDLPTLLDFAKRTKPLSFYLSDHVLIRPSVLFSILRRVGRTRYDVLVYRLSPIEAKIFGGLSVVTSGNGGFTIRMVTKVVRGFLVVELSGVQVSEEPILAVANHVWYQHPNLTLDMHYTSWKMKELLSWYTQFRKGNGTRPRDS